MPKPGVLGLSDDQNLGETPTDRPNVVQRLPHLPPGLTPYKGLTTSWAVRSPFKKSCTSLSRRGNHPADKSQAANSRPEPEAMESNGQHCPFLNRADPRCGEAFNIERLDHAFRYCFGKYTACSVYIDLLVERRVKQSAAMESREPHDAGNRIIQVTVHRSVVEPVAPPRTPALPHVSGSGKRARR